MDGAEECDDGNMVDIDACTKACKSAICGDGVLHDGVEMCDDANPIDTDDCRNDCSLAKCGDGVVNAGKETCDDGNVMAGDGCDASCKNECGNGVVEGIEQCDDGNGNGNDTCSNACSRLAYHVFVTSAKYPANLGFSDASKACNTLATTAKLPGAGNFKAWLSTKVDEESLWLLLLNSTKPYILTTNVKVADTWTDLVDGDLFAAISITELKQPATMVNPVNCNAADAAEALVWTNTTTTGVTTPANACSNWSVVMAEQEGGVGLLNRKDVLWTDACTLTCDKTARFYCVEQPPP